jgi:dTDP-4-dehydrorhamnose reductase
VTVVAVTGSQGQVGRALVEAADRAGLVVVALDRHGPDPIDLADADALRARLVAARPEVVVHAAAWTDVDGCELDPERAHHDNVAATEAVAATCEAVGAHLAYLSTDYVYDGTKAGPYVEGDEPRPLSVYGATKLAGERALPPGSTVVRTAWVCGRHGRNLPRTILELARDRAAPLRVVDDQVGQPTIAEDLAPLVLRLALDRLAGVVHVTNQGPVSWYQLACEVLELADLGPERVVPIATDQLDPPRPARRPANSVLAPARLEAEGYPLLPDHRASLPALVADLLGQPNG